MCKIRLTILTFVLLASASSHARPHQHAEASDQDNKISETASDRDDHQQRIEEQHLILVKPAKTQAAGYPYIHTHRRAISIRTAGYYDSEMTDICPTTVGVGVTATAHSRNRKHLEIGATSIFPSPYNGVIFGGLRMFLEEHQRLRYFYSLGPSLLVDADESLLGVTKIDNYALWLQAGLEYTIKGHHGIRLDLESFLATNYQNLGLVAGYQWTW